MSGWAAYNWRFHTSGGVCPQKPLCEFASESPARTLVNPRLREAARTLQASRLTVSSGHEEIKLKAACERLKSLRLFVCMRKKTT